MKQFDELRTVMFAHNVPDDAFRLLSEIEAKWQNTEQKNICLEAFADSGNWRRNAFVPTDSIFSTWSPDEMAARVLLGGKIA